MRRGNILFVHGTGVRLKAYQKTYLAACDRAKKEGITLPLVECEWGDALGIEAPMLALPGAPDPDHLQKAAEPGSRREGNNAQACIAR